MPKGPSGQKRKAEAIGNVVYFLVMAFGLEQRLWDIGDIVNLTEEWEAQ